MSLPTLLEQIVLAERQNNFLNLIKARFNLADYYRFAAIQCLKAKSTDKAIKQFESAKDVLEKCLHSIDDGIPNLSDEAMAEFKLLHDWAGVVLEEVSTQLEKLSQKLKRSLDRLDKSRLQAKESIINSQGMQAWFKPQAPSRDELSEKAKERITCKETLEKANQLNTLFQKYKNHFAIQKKQLIQEGFETLVESNSEQIAESDMSAKEDRQTPYDDSLDLIPTPIPSTFSVHERRLSFHSFFESEKKAESERKRMGFGRLNSDIDLHTGLQLTENETIILPNALPLGF